MKKIIFGLIIAIFLYLFIRLINQSINQRSILRNIAFDTIDTFNKLDIDYWVDFGTLLGIVREQDIIKGDNDVDICVVDSPDTHSKMKKAKIMLERKGYTFVKETWDAYRVKKYTFFADIYINKINSEKGVYTGATGDNSNIDMNYIGSKSVIKWKNLDVKCPADVHGTLLWRYGEDYMTPKSGYKGRDC